MHFLWSIGGIIMGSLLTAVPTSEDCGDSALILNTRTKFIY